MQTQKLLSSRTGVIYFHKHRLLRLSWFASVSELQIAAAPTLVEGYGLGSGSDEFYLCFPFISYFLSRMQYPIM